MNEEKGLSPENLLGIGTWVRQGPATLVVRENGWVVLVPGTRKHVTEAAWEVLGRRPAPEEFLEAFLDAGELESIDGLKALLFGLHDGTTGTFGVKGATPILVHTAEGAQLVAGTEAEPFVLRTLEGVGRTAFGDLPAEEAMGLPRVGSGIIPVRGFVHATVDPAELGEAERAALAEQVEEHGRSIEDPEARKRRASAPKPPARPAGSSASAPLIKPPTADRATGSMPASLSGAGSGRIASPAAEAEPQPSGPNMFDGLFAGVPSKPEASPAESTAPQQAPPPAQRPVPAAVPAPAPPPAPARTAPAPTSSPEPTPAPEPTSAPAPTPTPAPAPTARPIAGEPAVAPGARSAAKRRLVSTSLFDRGRRSATTPQASAPSAAEASGTVQPEATSALGAASAQEPPAVPPASATPAAPPPSAATPARLPVSASVPTPEPPDDDEFDSPPTLVAPIEDQEELSSPPTLVAPIDDEHREDEPASRPARRGAAPAVPAGDLENTGAYDDLFGKTVFRRIEDAAVRRSEDEEDDAEEHTPESASAASPAPRPAPSPVQAAAASQPQSAGLAPQPAEPAGGGEFIDWVPGVGRAAPEVAQTAARRAAEVPRPQPAYPQVQMPERAPAPQPAPRRAPSGDDAMQAAPARSPHPPAPAAAQQARPLSWGAGMPSSASGSGQVVGGGVTLTGLVCPNGHANSPEHTACRACGAPLPREPRTVVRPPLGAVAITGGERILLDRTAIVGRRPRASRVSGNEVPQLITVRSPQQDISRSHVELRLEGWHVVALDLGTTNGTTLHRQGYEPLRLRPREGMVLRHGDRLDLGDDVHLTYRERA